MAIQNRRGAYADFDPTKMVAGEFAVVQTGDPNADDGKAVYMAFSSGSVKRLATYEDMQQNIADATEDIAQNIENVVADDVAAAQQAAEQAQQAAETLTIDSTLTHTGQAADAKATGDKISSLKEDLNIGETYSLTWEQGGLNNSGNTSSSNYDIRVRSTSYVDIIDDSIAIVVPQGYKLLIHVYDRTNGTSHLGYLPSADDITDNAEFTISAYYPNATHLKFVLGKVDNSNVSPTIAELYKFTTKLNNITRLTEEINNTKNNVARNTANIPVSAFLSAINRMCVCGASWDSGYVYTEQGSTVERSYIAWGYQLSKKYNFTFVCSARHSLYTKTWLTSPYGIAYVNKHDPCDLYVLTFGGNDSKQGTEYLGTLEDITSHESYDDYADSFYGNYGKIVEQIQEHAPNALIVCGMYNDGTTPKNQYYTALQNICEHYRIPVFNWYEDEWYRTYLQDNLVGSHPTATLHSGIALAFERIYNNLVVDNYNYFKFLRTKGDGADEQGAIPKIDPTLSVAGEAADAKKTGDEIGALKEELNAINVAPGLTWTYGKKIDESGNIFNSTVSAMSGKIEVEPGDFIKRFGVTTDSSAFTLMVDVNTYSDGVWQARYALYKQGDTLTIGAGINSIVFTFSRTNASGVVMTEANINAYFNVAVYRQGALGIDLDKLSKKCDSGLTSSSDNDLVCLSVNAYNPDAPGVQVGYGYRGETNDIVQISGYIISDYIPIKQTDYLRFMVDGYDCLSERPHGSSFYSRKIAVFDENKNWIFTRNITNNPYDTPVVNLDVDGYLRVQIGENDKASVFVSSITKQKYVDVIIFMGQSNMAGRGVTNESHTETAPVIINGAGYEFKSITDPTKLVPMEEPFGKNENVSGSIDDRNKKTGGPVVAFTNAYFTHNGGYPVVGVSASEGGTTISQWQPETNRLTDALSRLSTAITWLNSNGYRIRHKYMAWCQGESDGDSGTAKATYKSSFSSMFDAMKSAGIEKCFLFRIGEYNGSGSTDYSDIIAAQTEICQDDPDIIMITANQASYKERGMMKDSFHYYQDGYNEMGTFGGVNAAFYVTRGKEPTMYDPKYDNLYYSHIN